MLLYWLLLVFVFSCLFLTIPLLLAWIGYDRFAGVRVVRCPDTQQPVGVRLSAFRAALTGIDRAPSLRIAECSRWAPLRVRCHQQCLPDALAATPEPDIDIAPRHKTIYHLPVLMAAFLAWCLGHFWHAQYSFRESWMASIGLSPADVHQILWWRASHLATAMASLLFAYGVAWALFWRKKNGLGNGVLMAVLLWLAVAITASAASGWRDVPVALLRVEVPYTLLASVLMGAIVGSLNGKLVLERLDA